MSFVKDMLSKSDNISCVRVMALVCVGVAGLVSILGVIRGADLYGLTVLVATILGTAFTGKVAQKKLESKE